MERIVNDPEDHYRSIKRTDNKKPFFKMDVQECYNISKRYSWEEANILIIKITASVIVRNLFRMFRPFSGAIVNDQLKLCELYSSND